MDIYGPLVVMTMTPSDIQTINQSFIPDDPLDFKCANVKEDGKWHGWGCDWDYLSVICKFIPSGNVINILECINSVCHVLIFM